MKLLLRGCWWNLRISKIPELIRIAQQAILQHPIDFKYIEYEACIHLILVCKNIDNVKVMKNANELLNLGTRTMFLSF